MITPIARASAFDLSRNALNSENIEHLLLAARQRSGSVPMLPFATPRRRLDRPRSDAWTSIPRRDAAGYALTEPALISAARCSTASWPRRPRPGRAVDAEPPRPDRRRDRHRQDQDPAVLAGQLSEAGVPVLRGGHQGRRDGLAAPGDAANPEVIERVGVARLDVRADGHPVEFLSLSGKLGAQVRATRPLLRAGAAGQGAGPERRPRPSILSLIFKYCDDNQLPLLDLADLRTTLQFLTSDEGKPVLAEYGGMSARRSGCCCARSSC